MRERLEGRNGKVWDLYTLHAWTQERIAEELGLTQPRVSQIIAEVRAQIPADDLVEIKSRQTEALGSLMARTAEILTSQPPPAYSNGRPILDENGQMVRDVTTHLAAVDRALKIMERTAKLLGLDATTKVEVAMGEQAREAAAAAAADALSRMAEHETET